MSDSLIRSAADVKFCFFGRWLSAMGCIPVVGLTCFGPTDEWHLNHDKPLRHIAFDLGAGFSQVRELPVVSFLNTGLVAIGAVGDAVGGDGVEQDVV